MALDTALGARRDRGARDRSARDFRDVSGDRGSVSGGHAADVVAPRPLGQATSTLRATLRVAPAAPSSRSASGGLSLLVPPTRPAVQRRGLPRRLLPTGPRSFRPSGAALRKQSWSGRPPPSLPAPEQSSVPDGPGNG